MRQRDVPTDRHVDKCLGTDKLDRVEQIHQNLVNPRCALSELLLHSRTEIELTERPNLETPREFQISIRFGQMSNSNEAENTDFEHFVASVLSHEQVYSQRGYPALDLNIKPDEVLSVEEHQTDELLVGVLRERLK